MPYFFARVGGNLLVAVLYFLAARLGLSMAFEQANVSPFWPPSGMALTTLLIAGRGLWPGIWLGALLGSLSAPTPWLPSMCIATGNTLEALVAYLLIQRVNNGHALSSPRYLAVFLVVTAAACSLSATTGVLTLRGFEFITAEQSTILWKTWWTGDVMGILLITPLVLAWRDTRWIDLVQTRGMDILLIGSLTILLSWMVFSNNASGSLHYSASFLLIPLASIAAIRLGPIGATTIALMLAAISISMTLANLGPFVTDNANLSLLLLQLFLGVTALTGLILASIEQVRQDTQTALHTALHTLESRVAERTRALRASNTALSSSNQALSEQIEKSEQTRDALRALLATSNAANQQGFYDLCARSLATIYGARTAFIGVFEDKSQQRIRTLTVHQDGVSKPGFSYDLNGTPCQDVLDNRLELVEKDAAARYPNNPMLTEMGIESYFGAPVVLPSGRVLGILAVLDSKPMQPYEWLRPIIRLFANRLALELERAENQRELELAASVFEESQQAIVISDAQNNILKANPAFCRISGYSFPEVIGQPASLLKSEHHDDTFYASFWQALLRDNQWQGEMWDRRKNGELFPIWQNISVVRDAHGSINGFISIFTDLGERKEFEDCIYHLAHHDLLTGLPNRMAFTDILEQAVHHAHRNHTGLAVLQLDLDNFKLLNETAGHRHGDDLLKETAQRIKGTLREDDIVSRFGGDEFTILLTDLTNTADTVGVVANKLMRALRRPYQLGNGELSMSASLGISTYPDCGLDAATLLKNADAAMYRAKESGRNTFQFFTADINQRAQSRLDMEAALHRALENNEFVLYFQPQFRLTDGLLVGCEALLRWQRPGFGLVPPDQFIPIAEQSSLIVELGDWVLATACHQRAAWHGLCRDDFRIAVNLSARQFSQRDLLKQVALHLHEAGVQPRALELELTESMLMENLTLTQETLRQLQSLGVSVSLDDFGTGYSSLASLKQFPIDTLKIDRSFVRDMEHDTSDAAIVRATLAMAHALNLAVVAEGVETTQQLTMLAEHNCNLVQGYLLSRPIPAEQMIAWFQRGQITTEAVPERIVKA